MSGARKLPTLLVLASTYPRWKGDPEPGFVHELCRRLTDYFNVVALVPDAAGADPDGMMDGVEVVRYRYAPRRFQTLVNNGGIVANLRRSPWKWLLVPGFVLAQWWVARRIIRRRDVAVMHAHWVVPQGLVAGALRLTTKEAPPFVVTAHGADLFALRSRPLETLKRYIVSRASAVTVVSETMVSEVVRLGGARASVSVQPMGVDLRERFAPGNEAVRSRNELLFVGRLVEKKGLRYLIDAMPAIVSAHPQAHLTVVGFGPESRERREQAEALGIADSVKFEGAIPQERLPELYRRAAVFVAPFTTDSSGDQEGLGLVVIEAAGCGCRLVLGDVPAVRAAFGGLAGVNLVAQGNPDLLAKACLDALSSSASTGGLVEHLRMRFDWHERARQYARILQAIGTQRSAAQILRKHNEN